MLRYHPTFKATKEGFIPMVTIRNAKGQMIGSKVPKGGAREFNTYTSAAAAESAAYLTALRVADRLQHDGVNVQVQ